MLDNEINKIQRAIGYKFRDTSLLEAAFTHESYVNEVKTVTGYDRLEFLGDAVLQLIVSQELYQKLSDNSGKMTAFRAKIVSREPLAAAIDKLNVMQYMRVGIGAYDNVTSSVKARSDLFEAIVAAIYIDSLFCLDEARKFVMQYLDTGLNTVDYKSMLQEYSQKHFKGNPTPKYTREQDAAGKLFVARVFIADEECGQGEGQSRQKAEKAAAKQALERLGILS